MQVRSYDQLNEAIKSASFDLVGWGLQTDKDSWRSLGVDSRLVSDHLRPIVNRCITPASHNGVHALELVGELERPLGLLATDCMEHIVFKGKEAGAGIYRRLMKAHLERAYLNANQSGNIGAIRKALNDLNDFEENRTGRQISLRSLTIEEILGMAIPKRSHVIYPLIPCQGLSMLYAPRGMGKTFASLSLAYAVATGSSVWGFKAPTPRKVLYLDGEMPASAIQERLAGIVAGSDAHPPSADYLNIITPDVQPCPMPNLAEPEGQATVDILAEQADLLVIDNIATLARKGRENDAESWSSMQAWLLDLRRRGKSVLLVHHAGKGGNQRGTSAREDVLDVVMAMRRPKDYTPEEGARFEIHFEKARGVCGEAVKPLEVKLIDNQGALSWEIRELKDVEREQVLAMKKAGMSIREIAEEMGFSKSKVQRTLASKNNASC